MSHRWRVSVVRHESLRAILVSYRDDAGMGFDRMYSDQWRHHCRVTWFDAFTHECELLWCSGVPMPPAEEVRAALLLSVNQAVGRDDGPESLLDWYLAA